MSEWTTTLGDGIKGMETLGENSVDLILTDPPYYNQFLHLYEDMARVAAVVLKPGGSLVAIAPHYALPQVCAWSTKYLRYHWIIGMSQLRYEKRAQVVQYGVFVRHKPILWFTKGHRNIRGRKFLADSFDAFDGKTMKQNKKKHPLAQPLTFPEHCMRIAPAEAVVVDPFMGSCGVGVIALRTGRDFYGWDVDPECVQVASEALVEEDERLASGAHTGDLVSETTAQDGPDGA